MKTVSKWTVAAAMLVAAVTGAHADEVLKVGVFVPMSGAAAGWGLGAKWVGEQAAQEINDHGGIKAGGKTYKVESIAYENGYNSADGSKAAQAMLSRDGIRFIIQGIGTAPVKALQSLSERQGALLMQIAWGKSVKGPQAPLTFTNSNTPFELFGPMFDLVKKTHPEAKTVAMLNANDATGHEVEDESAKQYKARGYDILASTWYERGTTEFQPIATKLAQTHADLIDLSGAPPSDAGMIYKELAVQGWKGIKMQAAGTGSDAMVKVGGLAVEGVYMGNAADFGGPNATPVQRKLNEGALKTLNEPLHILALGAWDGMMAVKAGIEKADSIDPKKVAKVLPEIVFESSYGPMAFGGKETYGSPQQLLVPVIVTQIKDGQTVEIARVQQPELEQRLAKKP
jgi:branched-chain amino acid transport system substrate-binding protein